MVGYNAIFYALSYYEFPSTRITVGVRSKASLTSRTFSTTSTVQSSTGSNSSYEKGTNHISRSTQPREPRNFRPASRLKNAPGKFRRLSKCRCLHLINFECQKVISIDKRVISSVYCYFLVMLQITNVILGFILDRHVWKCILIHKLRQSAGLITEKLEIKKIWKIFFSACHFLSKAE